MKMRARQPRSSIERRVSPPSLNPVSVIPLCKVDGLASLTFLPFLRRDLHDRSRREKFVAWATDCLHLQLEQRCYRSSWKPWLHGLD